MELYFASCGTLSGHDEEFHVSQVLPELCECGPPTQARRTQMGRIVTLPFFEAGALSLLHFPANAGPEQVSASRWIDNTSSSAQIHLPFTTVRFQQPPKKSQRSQHHRYQVPITFQHRPAATRHDGLRHPPNGFCHPPSSRQMQVRELRLVSDVSPRLQPQRQREPPPPFPPGPPYNTYRLPWY
jgi:hypothetical protein